jgi:predicted MPP superfamily phosphohydrolase
MSRMLVISDLHFHDWDTFSETQPSGLGNRFHEQLQLFNYINLVNKYFKENEYNNKISGIDYILFGGDMWHKRKEIWIQ